ncbi:MAG: SagB family peptide dehydrogenase, partial [Xanthobacteraceae bacterium]
RRALPEPVLQRAAQAPATAPPLDVLQRMSVLIAQELKLASVDAQHNLLALGATSMDLVRIVTRLQKELDFRPSFQQFLRNPSVAALAELYRETNDVAVASIASPATQPRINLELMLDGTAKEAFRRANSAIRAFPAEWGRLRLGDKRPHAADERISRRRGVRRFRAEPVPSAALAALLAELSRMTTETGEGKYVYGSAGGLYPVQTYLHAKADGVAGVPAGTFYYHPAEHALIPIMLGAELSAEIHEPFTNQPIFQQARFSLFLVDQPRAIEPVYGDLAWRFSMLEAGAMAHALETSAWRLGLGLCPVGWLDFSGVRGLLQLEDGQELLHAHVGGLPDGAADGDWEEGII